MSSEHPLLLVIEDERQMLRFLRASLSAHGYRLCEAETAADGLAQTRSRAPDVILLDLMLPDGDGIDVARALREGCRTPIVVLSARGQEEDKIRALDAGADDYLTKPFSVGELLARIRLALRHAAQVASGNPQLEFTSGDLRVDLARL